MAYFPTPLESEANPRSPAGNIRTFLAVSGAFYSTEEVDLSAPGAQSSSYPYPFPSQALASVRGTDFVDDFYFKIRYFPATLNLGVVSRDLFEELHAWNGFFDDRVLEDVTLNNGEGMVLGAPATPTTFSPLQLTLFTLDVSKDGPSNISATVDFDWEVETDDDSIFITGTRTVVFPFLFQPGRTTEILSWKTQVMTAEDGNEKRIRIRNAPRQGFNLTVFAPRGEENLLDNILYARRGELYTLPNSAECKFLTADTSLSSGIVDVVTADADFRVGGSAIIYNSARDFEIFEIFSIQTTTLTATANITKVMLAGAFVIPLLLTRMVRDPTRNFTANRAAVRMSMEAIDNIVLPSSASPIQYQSEDTYLDDVNYPGEKGVSIYGRNLQVLDYSASKPELFQRWINTKVAQRVLVQMDSLAEIQTFRTWLHRRAGKSRPFWMPTHENDFKLVSTGILSSNILVRDDGQLNLTGNRINLAVKHTGGWVLVNIVQPMSQAGDNLAVTLNMSIGIDAADVISISYFDLKRLASDDIEIQWDGNFTAHCIFSAVNVG